MVLGPTMLTGVLRLHFARYSVTAIAETTMINAIISGILNNGGMYPLITVGVVSRPEGASTVYFGVVSTLAWSTPMLGSCSKVPLPKYG